jgi:hypothetical protein
MRLVREGAIVQGMLELRRRNTEIVKTINTSSYSRTSAHHSSLTRSIYHSTWTFHTALFSRGQRINMKLNIISTTLSTALAFATPQYAQLAVGDWSPAGPDDCRHI